MKVTADTRGRAMALTAVTLCAFAANSLFCRAALAHTTIDPATFTAIRLASGALVLAALVPRAAPRLQAGSWGGAATLLVYAVLFSFAYITLTAATGALLLFVAVQATMITYGIVTGERLATVQWCGIAMALSGLVLLVAPGIQAPDPLGALLMLGSGVAWGVYSLIGRRSSAPLATTAGNFLRAAPFALLLLASPHAHWDATGAVWALLSGILASGLGYAVWYAALPLLRATTAATVQLAVPVIAGVSGALLLGEPLTVHFAIASTTILGGIAIVLRGKR